CEMMGGRIAVESSSGKGATFTILLPAEIKVETATGRVMEDERDKQSGVNSLAALSRSVASGSVLVIDDDSVIRELLTAFLTKEGYEVTLAEGGEDGLRLAREVRPDLITLDVAMPGMDGWTVLSALKADSQLADIPVIMLTMIEDRTTGYALGASEYMTKPIDRERLGKLLRRYGSLRHHPVLVVEDDPDTRHLLQTLLQREGWKVQVAENGRDALEQITSGMADAVFPGLILLDLMMPELDGLTFLEIFRRLPAARAVPVIVLTAKELTTEERRQLNGSVEKVMQKGTSTELVLNEVREILNSYLGKTEHGSNAPVTVEAQEAR